MKNYVTKIKEGIIFGIFVLATISVGIFAYENYYTEIEPDFSAGDTLSSEMFNQLVTNTNNLITNTNELIADTSELKENMIKLEGEVAKDIYLEFLPNDGLSVSTGSSLLFTSNNTTFLSSSGDMSIDTNGYIPIKKGIYMVKFPQTIVTMTTHLNPGIQLFDKGKKLIKTSRGTMRSQSAGSGHWIFDKSIIVDEDGYMKVLIRSNASGNFNFTSGVSSTKGGSIAVIKL